MWTPETRALVGQYGSGQALSDDQYRLLEPLIPAARSGGRPRTTDMRRLLDGLFYLVRTGCQWRHLPPPPAFPPWATVYGTMRLFLRDGVWENMRHQFVIMLREGEGREPSPTATVLDTQSVKTTESGGPRGWDAAKKVKGRKRHIAVDTQGLLLGVIVHAASIQDADSAGDLLRRLKPPATPVGGRAHARLARAMAPPVQRLRTTARGFRGDGHPGHDSPHAAPSRSPKPQATASPMTFKTGSDYFWISQQKLQK